MCLYFCICKDEIYLTISLIQFSLIIEPTRVKNNKQLISKQYSKRSRINEELEDISNHTGCDSYYVNSGNSFNV